MRINVLSMFAAAGTGICGWRRMMIYSGSISGGGRARRYRFWRMGLIIYVRCFLMTGGGRCG